MERWLPLFEIFLNSPCPQGEASLWMQQQQQHHYQHQHHHDTRPSLHSLSPPAFISLLLSPHTNNSTGCMLIETLPYAVQARILSFLAMEYRRFPSQDLLALSTSLLNRGNHLDFWVKKAALHLFDTMSDNSTKIKTNLPSNSNSFLGLIGVQKLEEDFNSLPEWLHSIPCDDPVLAWLPLSHEALCEHAATTNVCICDKTNTTSTKSSLVEIEDDKDDIDDGGCIEEMKESGATQSSTIGIENEQGCADTLETEMLVQVNTIKARLKTSSSTSETVSLAKDIYQLCLDTGLCYSSTILGLIEPWEADDETASILLSHLSDNSEDGFISSGLVLASVILPKMLVLQEPASRVLVTAIVHYCKLNQRMAVDALLLPSVLVKEGINTPLCDVLTRILRECLHPVHVSAFCQKLLCSNEAASSFVCLPCHHHLISGELVWTDALFTLFQNMLNCSIYLAQDSIDHIVTRLDEIAHRFSKSLKFSNFLLCFVGKCAPSLKVHRLLLLQVAKRTNTFITNSIISKLDAWRIEVFEP